MATAEAEQLDVTAIVADLVSFEPDGLFDVILIDRTLHMLDDLPRLDVLKRLVPRASDTSSALIADEKPNLAGFKRIMKDSPMIWAATLETKVHLFYHSG